MFKSLLRYAFVFLTAVLFSCGWGINADRIPLAKVGERTLFMDDLRSVLPSGLSYDDSLMMAEDYIKKWIMNELLVRKAEDNLTPSQKDLTKELNDYRNSMITYRYKMELMLQKLDTLVSEREIDAYHEKNKDNFILNKNIVKAIYIKIPSEVSKPEQVKVFCEQVSDDNLSELREFCLKFAITYDIFVDNWIDFEFIAGNLPQPIDNQEDFLRRNTTVEFRDKDFYYLLCIIDFRLANSVAPVEYVSESIKSLIINKRRIEFLKKVEDDVYLEGVRFNKFKLYSYEPDTEN